VAAGVTSPTPKAQSPKPKAQGPEPKAQSPRPSESPKAQSPKPKAQQASDNRLMRLSILDLAPVPQGSTPAEALRNTLDLAQHAERWGYHRFWLAEHHNMPGIASAATAIVIGYVAGGTTSIRVGAGGIMLPNHSPLVVAEQFGTLASLYPGRI